MSTRRRDRAYREIETSRQIADRLERHAGRTNHELNDQLRIRAMRDVLDQLDTGDRSDGRMVENRIRSLAVEAVAWLEAIEERRELARSDVQRTGLRAVK